MASPGWWHLDSLTRTGRARLALGWPRREGTRINLTRTTLTGLTGMTSPYGGTRISLAGMALELALLRLASLGWRQDDLTGTGFSMTLLGLVLLGLASLGQHWDGLVGMVAP